MAKNVSYVSTIGAKKSEPKVQWRYPFTRQDMIYFGISLGVIILGYLLMATGVTEEAAVPDGKWNNPLAVTVAPILLTLGYCVMIPLSILKIYTTKKSGNNNAQEQI